MKPALLFAALIMLVVDLAFANDVDIYTSKIKPILKAKCYSCHGAIKQRSKLRLETRQLMITGGKSGAIISPGKPEKSLLFKKISARDKDRMPPPGEGSRLSDQEIKLIEKWIANGALAPDENVPESPTQHWAFQRIEAPPLPPAPPLNSRKTPFLNPIDRFIESKRANHTLMSQPRADRNVLIRRLYLDLIGLPPTTQQLKDDRPWPEIVNELLASPHHGERWARHWMDIWRYTDWYGLGAQLRNSQKHIWHWRDWIVESLNDDKGYDRMILEMLAGDELAPHDQSVLRATGFLARNYYLFNRTTWLDSTIEHTGKAFLGLTLNCAKCHDHKYDPITHVDYYKFRAIFEPHQVRLDPIPGVIDFEKDGLPRVFDDHLDMETFLHLKGDPKNPDKETEISPGVPAFLASFETTPQSIELPPSAYAPSVRDYVQQDLLADAISKLDDARSKLAQAQKKLAESPAPVAKINPDTSSPFDIADQFDKLKDELWEIVGEGWKFENGSLHLTKPTREPAMVRLRKTPPQDFDLTCRYTTTGGSTYKSVTFRFDQDLKKKYDNFVYTSAHAPGPKVQAAYTRKGQTSYPAEGRVARDIKIGETYTLRLAVRKRLVNVWLNDEFQLAYMLPDRNPKGDITISGFDATVSFDSISIRSLEEGTKLTAAKNGNVIDTEADVSIARLNVDSKKAALDSLRATLEADRIQYSKDRSEDAFRAAQMKAAKLQALAEQSVAEYEIAANASDSNKLKAAKTKLTQANKKLKSVADGTHEYTSIRAAKKALETPAHKETNYPPVYPTESTGRRSSLANWLTHRDNPLTARVAVNHVWMRHFGEPLVESVFDFGLRAKKPEHAALLDYLAAEFMESNWSFRHLHRLIVTSDTYQLSSSTLEADPATVDYDATNKFYWRMNSRRMEAQVIRDNLLHLAGVMDATVGGPSLDPSDTSTRRSLYFKHSRDQQDKFLSMFDDADHLQCYRRSASIVPQQALALSNSKLAIAMTEKITQRITSRHSPLDRSSFINHAFETLLCRLPEKTERDECLSFLKSLMAIHKSPDTDSIELRIRTRLVHALLNHNDFISIR